MKSMAGRNRELLHLLQEARASTMKEIQEILSRQITAQEERRASRPSDWGDQVVQHLDSDLDAALLEQKNLDLRRIEHALARLSEGTYGTCEACGQPIPTARLQLLPFATRCVSCAE